MHFRVPETGFDMLYAVDHGVVKFSLAGRSFISLKINSTFGMKVIFALAVIQEEI